MLNKINISSKEQILIVYIVLAAVTLAVFWQVNQYDFIYLDDNIYVKGNSHIHSGITLAGFRWAFSTTYAEFWHPLTWLSLMLDYQLFGVNAGGYHRSNLILHILSTLLLFWLFYRMTGAIWKSAFVAAFFALHPLRVESVVWIAERKDVLSVFLGMLTLCLYVYYTEKPAIKRYMLVVFSFVCALMSKPMIVTLPVVMILLDYWPLGRFQPDKIAENPTPVIQVHAKKEKQQTGKKALEKNVSPSNNRKLPETKIAGIIPLWQLREKTPFFILSAIFSIITIYAQRPMFANEFSFTARFANAPVSFVKYLENTFWPHNLAVYYPFSDKLSLWQVFGSTLLIIIISIAVIMAWKRLPYLFVGWLWYSITLIPVIGIIRSTSHSMHDCYTYLPSIGLAVMLAWGVPSLLPRKNICKMFLLAAAIVSLCTLAILTRQQCRYWENDKELWSHALQVTKNNYLAYNGVGLALVKEGKIKDAINNYNEAIRINPNYLPSYISRGFAYFNLGQYQWAIDDCNKAIRLNKNWAEPYFIRGDSYYNFGQYHLAIENYNEAIRLNTENANAYMNRGAAYLKQGNNEQGCRDMQKACELGQCKFLKEAKGKGYCR